MTPKKRRQRILILEPLGYSPKARDILLSFADLVDGPMSRDSLIRALPDIDVLIVRLGHMIDAEILICATRLRAIVTATTGLNHIAIDEAAKRGISVLSLKGDSAFLDQVYATAEHTWALLLSSIRKIPQANSSVIGGEWDRDRFKGGELNGKSLGVIGLGRLGVKVARFGLAFGMRVLACDIRPELRVPDGVMLVSMSTLLSESDFITIHVDSNSNNVDLIGEKQFSQMKIGASLINTSRGEIVNEEALLSALKGGRLSAAALDVMRAELGDRRESGLLDYARSNTNLIITPHIGGCTYESMEKTEIFMAEKLLAYVSS